MQSENAEDVKAGLLFTQDLAFTAKSVRKRIYCK